MSTVTMLGPCRDCGIQMRSQKPLDADGERAYGGRGLCHTCYTGERRHGHLDQWPLRDNPGACLICACRTRTATSNDEFPGTRKHMGGGLCDNCYHQRRARTERTQR